MTGVEIQKNCPNKEKYSFQPNLTMNPTDIDFVAWNKVDTSSYNTFYKKLGTI